MNPAHEAAAALLGQGCDALDPRTQKVARHVAARMHIAREVLHELDTHPTRGQRAADAVASLGGSWTFGGLFAATMPSWVAVNAVLLLSRGDTFDLYLYPYILLNLFLSMLAAIQAPGILMSQNRQGEKDRASAEHDDEVKLKAELDIMLLHQKLDALRQTQWRELIALHQVQIQFLTRLAGGRAAGAQPPENLPAGAPAGRSPSPESQRSKGPKAQRPKGPKAQRPLSL